MDLGPIPVDYRRWRFAMRVPVFVVAASLAACGIEPRQVAEPVPQAVPELPVEAAPAPEAAPVPPPPRELTFAAVGDIMLGTDFPDNRLPDDDGWSFLSGVAPILSAADIAFGNLESVLIDGGEPAKRCGSPTSCYVFRTPTRYAWHLAAAGFDVLSHANNHAHDFGEPGRAATEAALDGVGIHHSGRIGDVASWEYEGLRLAMIAFAPNIGAHSLNDLPGAVAMVSALAAVHDIVMVSFHGGAEGAGAGVLPFEREIFLGEDRGAVVEFSRAMVDAGADLVIGHGPHVLRAMELYNDRLIAYSLGNFATYYGVSVADERGLGAIVVAKLAADGRFLEGRVEPTVQIRPGGPVIDGAGRAIRLLQGRIGEAFPEGGLVLEDDGRIFWNPGPY